MGLSEKLDRMCTEAFGSADRDLGYQTRQLADILVGVLRERRWADLSTEARREIDEAATLAVEAAEVVDAALCLASRVFGTDNAKIHDLKLKSDLHGIQEEIRTLFDTGQVPSRGFVYVAWSARPERFMYVGKANNVDRLNLTTHGKLSNSAAHVSTLSLIFPGQSREDILLEVEASVIRLVKHGTGKLPELNLREESVPAGGSSKHLHQLGTFLRDVARKIELSG